MGKNIYIRKKVNKRGEKKKDYIHLNVLHTIKHIIFLKKYIYIYKKEVNTN
jgi:hypothetical protein